MVNLNLFRELCLSNEECYISPAPELTIPSKYPGSRLKATATSTAKYKDGYVVSESHISVLNNGRIEKIASVFRSAKKFSKEPNKYPFRDVAIITHGNNQRLRAVSLAHEAGLLDDRAYLEFLLE